MTNAPHRNAALRLLNECPSLSHKEAGFLGHVCVAAVVTEKQRDWLDKLSIRNGILPNAEGNA